MARSQYTVDLHQTESLKGQRDGERGWGQILEDAADRLSRNAGEQLKADAANIT